MEINFYVFPAEGGEYKKFYYTVNQIKSFFESKILKIDFPEYEVMLNAAKGKNYKRYDYRRCF